MRKILTALLLAALAMHSLKAHTHDAAGAGEDRDAAIREFVAYADSLVSAGDQLAKSGFSLQAEWYYGHAYAAISSLRTALGLFAEEAENIENSREAEELESQDFGDWGSLLADVNAMAKDMESLSKTIEKGVDKLENWVEENGGYVWKEEDHRWYPARSKSPASPFPDYFRGLYADWMGNKDEAVNYYSRALSNPYLPSTSSFTFLPQMASAELRELALTLADKQSEYESLFRSDSYYCDIDEISWDDAYLNSLGIKAAQQEDLYTAARYLEAAAHANPFEISHLYNCASIYSQLGNAGKTAYWLEEYIKLGAEDDSILRKLENWKPETDR